VDEQEDGKKFRGKLLSVLKTTSPEWKITSLGSRSECLSIMIKLKKLSLATRCWSTSLKIMNLTRSENFDALSLMSTRDHNVIF
jgi:hypothetical protein